MSLVDMSTTNFNTLLNPSVALVNKPSAQDAKNALKRAAWALFDEFADTKISLPVIFGFKKTYKLAKLEFIWKQVFGSRPAEDVTL